MSNSILTDIGIIFKNITGIKDISVMEKNIHKRIGKIFYHKTYNADQIIAVMKEMGMKKGCTVCLHAAMKEFYNYRGTAEELIQKIMDIITPEGTLMMPAYPDATKIQDENFIFDIKKEPTHAGYLAETFRKFPHVIRSINVQHSVCAWGKNSIWLTKDHHKCTNCWDENSPWFRMTKLNALVFTLGLPSSYIGTFDHCVEAILYKKYPYWAQFFNIKRQYLYRDTNGIVKEYTSLTGNIERRTREKRLIRYFTSDIFKKKKLSNLQIKVFLSKPCLEKMIELGKKGITMYYVPSPKKYSFDR